MVYGRVGGFVIVVWAAASRGLEVFEHCADNIVALRTCMPFRQF